MNTIHREQLLNQLNWRCATKQFDAQRKIHPQDWAALEEALVLSPSSFGLQPWKFINVTDPAVREKLVPASWGQRQIADACHLVVFAVKKNLSVADVDAFIAHAAQVRGVPVASLADYRGMMIGAVVKGMDDATRTAWATKQVYLALGNFLTCAALLGIDACPMEGIEPAKYDEILGLDKLGLTAVVVATVGYRASGDKYAAAKKVRFAKQDVLVEV